MSKFKEGVVKVVKSVPYGMVVSYGQVALYIGLPRAARQVGWTLNRLEDNSSTSPGQVPWWRVINNGGRISIKGSKYTPIDQKRLLVEEGVVVDEDFLIDIEKYRFIPSDADLEGLELDPVYLEMISNKVPYSKYFRR